MEHTEGKIDTVDYAGHIEIQSAPAFYGEPNLLSADDVGHKTAIANGNRLVKCWNNYDELVKRNKKLSESLQDLMDRIPRSSEIRKEKVYHHAQEAINNAKS